MARILVADDEEDIRELIELVLTGDGHHVVTVADGMAAVEMHQHEVFDLIVSDLRMPRLTGIQVTEKVRANPWGEIPILLVTASASDEDRVQARRAGISAHGEAIQASRSPQPGDSAPPEPTGPLMSFQSGSVPSRVETT